MIRKSKGKPFNEELFNSMVKELQAVGADIHFIHDELLIEVPSGACEQAVIAISKKYKIIIRYLTIYKGSSAEVQYTKGE